jgi:hypothetical protein
MRKSIARLIPIQRVAIAMYDHVLVLANDLACALGGRASHTPAGKRTTEGETMNRTDRRRFLTATLGLTGSA